MKFHRRALPVYTSAVTSLHVGVVLLASTVLASSVAACASTAAVTAPESPCVASQAPAEPSVPTHSDASEHKPLAPDSTPSGSGEPVVTEPSDNQGAPEVAEASEVNEQPILEVDQGPAVGGPKNNRPCAFHESVDSYERRCITTKNADGSLRVEAKGTTLNPDNGFELTLRGGPHQFVARGTLDSFGICKGPFVAYVNTVIDKGVTTYEMRFKNHCKIVIR